jgi:hypothetical protein
LIIRLTKAGEKIILHLLGVFKFNIKNMTSKNLPLLLMILCESCCSTSKIEKPNFRMYYRAITGVNSYYTYLDYILVSNYEPNTIKLKELVNYAQNYIDTVHADKPVSGISFIGQAPCKKLPSVDDTLLEHRDYCVFGVAFNNGFRGEKFKDTTINIISIPNKKVFTFYFTSKSIDSLLLINPYVK